MLRILEYSKDICDQMGGKEETWGKIQGLPAEQEVSDRADHRHDQAVQKQPAAGRQTQAKEYPEHQYHPHENTCPVLELLQKPAAVRRVWDLPLPYCSALGTVFDMLLHRKDAVLSCHTVLNQGDQIHTYLTGDLDHGEQTSFSKYRLSFVLIRKNITRAELSEMPDPDAIS